MTTRSLEIPKFFIFEQENTCFTDISKMLNINKNIIFLILAFPIYLFSQNISESEIKSVAYQIIKESEYSMLVTLDSNNKPTTRLMDHNIINEDLVIYLITNPRSRKITHLNNNPSVSINFQSKDRKSYVSINGEAELINDISLKRKYWKYEWTPFYSDIENDCILIKINPQILEIVSSNENISSDPITWRPLTLIINN